MLKLLLVGAGSFLGGIARYALSGLVQRWAGAGFPWGTLAVNVTGCFAIGAVLHLVEDRAMLGPDARVFLVVGILGGFTTFSAFGWETFELLRANQPGLALINAAGSVTAGLAAVWLGRAALRAAGL
jgi:CrcB protein